MANTDFSLDTKKADAGLHYLRWLREASDSGKSFGGLVREIAGLSWGLGKLQPNEYFMYKLYDDQRFPPEVKKTFLGNDRLSLLLSALDMPWPEIAQDKPTLTALLRGHELPVPETQAMLHADRTFPGARSLSSKDDVIRFLRSQARYPLFSKPTNSVCSLGTANIERFDEESDSIVTGDQKRVSLTEFADQIEEYASGGYLFQTRLSPHPEIAAIVGDTISTVRMFVLVDDEGPSLLRASWKIPGAGTVADNFWRPGNMLGGIDVETGKVVRVLKRTEEGTEPVDSHPATGTSFEDLKFPRWDQMRDVVMRGAAAAPSCHLQGWDVALTDRGPILVELEGDGGDPIMEQLCFDSGLLQGRYLKFAEKAMKNRRERKKRAKERRRKRIRANLAQLTAASQQISQATTTDGTDGTDGSR